MARIETPRAPAPSRRGAAKATAGEAKGTVALGIAAAMGLLAGPKSRHLNAEVLPGLFEAAAKRAGTTSPRGPP
jgi:hypothetical protein